MLGRSLFGRSLSFLQPAVEPRASRREIQLMADRSIKGIAFTAAFYALLAGAMGRFVAQCIHDWPLTIDDAFISARYAHNLAQHFSLSWNPGISPPTEGYTNFLLVVLLAIPGRLGLSIITAAKMIGVLSGLGIIAWLALAGGRLARNRWAGLMAAGLFAFQGAAPAHAVSGLETLLFALLALLLIHSCLAILQAETISPRSIRWLCLAGLAAGWTRPEGAVVAGLMMTTILLVRWRRLKRSHFVAVALWFFLPGAIYMAWRLSFLGYLFPNTFYHKMHPASHEANKEYFRDFATSLVTLLPLVIIPLGFRWRPVFLVPLLAIAGTAAIYTVSDISNMGYGGRFLYPCLPAIYFLFAAAMGEILEARRSQRSLNPVEALFVAGLYAAMLLQVSAQTDFYRNWSYHYGYALKRAHVQLGKLLHRVSPAGRLTIWSDGGAIPYYSDWTAMDAVGLLDSYLAHHPDLPGDEFRKYFYAFHPDAIAMTAKSTDCSDAGGGSKVNVLKADAAWSEYARMGSFAFGPDYFQVVFGRTAAFDGRLRLAIESSPYNVDFDTTGTLLRGQVKVIADDSPLLPAVQFALAPKDLKPGAEGGLTRVYHTVAGRGYRLSGMIQDNCDAGGRPGEMLQVVRVDGAVADSHDLSAPAWAGWREFHSSFTARGDRTTVAILLEAAGKGVGPEWSALSTTQVCGLTLEDAAAGKTAP
jgi:hypothetical protein